MPSPLLFVGAAVGALVLLGGKKGPSGPRDGALPASTIEGDAMGRDVTVTESDVGTRIVTPTTGAAQLPPQIKTAPPPTGSPVATQPVIKAATQSTPVVSTSTPVKTATTYRGGETGTPIINTDTPRTIARAASSAGEWVGAIW